MIAIKRRCKFFDDCQYATSISKTCTENAGGNYCGVYRTLAKLQKECDAYRASFELREEKEKKRRKKNMKKKLEKKLVREDTSSRVVLKSVVVAYFAMWAVRQSPYLMPEELDKSIEEFDKQLHSNIKAGNETFIETTYSDLKGNIEHVISNSRIISSWNVAKKGSGPVFVSSYSTPKPDYDFIDLDALTRNIAQSVWLELLYDDGWFES